MGKNSVADLLSVDNLFTTQAERDEATRESILDIPLNEISDFPDHPFKVRMDENMMDMVESVKQYGVLVPALVRPKPDGGYEMIAGHRRKMASELAGKPILSCIVRDMTDDEATIVMVDSNLQREQILPSEKAFAYFMKDHTMEENAQFLAAHYGENGAGFYVNDRQYALWYNTDGIRIASGDSAQGRNVALLTWEQAAKRIRELLDLGRYMPQSELDMVSDHELRTLADRMLLLSRDISEEYWDAEYLPTMRLIHSSRQGFPEMVDQLQKLLIDPDMLQKIAVEWKTFADTHAQNPDILRFRFYRPKEISNQLQDLQLEPVTFIAAEDYNPQRHFYISGDEIDKVLRGSSADYRLGVYSFFANHPDQKESEKYLRDYHGEYSGYHGGNDNRVYTSKGLSFSHGDLTQPYRFRTGARYPQREIRGECCGNPLPEAD